MGFESRHLQKGDRGVIRGRPVTFSPPSSCGASSAAGEETREGTRSERQLRLPGREEGESFASPGERTQILEEHREEEICGAIGRWPVGGGNYESGRGTYVVLLSPSLAIDSSNNNISK